VVVVVIVVLLLSLKTRGVLFWVLSLGGAIVPPTSSASAQLSSCLLDTMSRPAHTKWSEWQGQVSRGNFG